MASPLLKVATVEVKGDIELGTFQNLKSAVESFGNFETLEVHINSRGGVLSQGLAIYNYLDMLKKKGKKVVTISRGLTASAATFISLGASKGERQIIRNGAYLIHEVMNGGDLFGAKSKELIEWGQQIEKDNETIASLYAKHTGNSIAQIRTWMAEDIYWDSQTALQRKFVDKVIAGNLNEAVNLGEPQDRISIYNPKEGLNFSLNSAMRYESYMQNNVGIPREAMPQINSDLQELFLAYFKARYGRGAVAQTQIQANELKPTQSEIDAQKVYEKIEAQSYNGREFIVSRENYLLDGHHDWAAALENNERELLQVVKIDLPIRTLVKEANRLKITYNEPLNAGAEEADLLLFLSIYYE